MPYTLILKHTFRLLTCAAVISAPMLATAGVYKWVDDEGTVHYSDTRPANVEAKSMKLQGLGRGSASQGSPQEKAQALDEAEQKRLEEQARRMQEETASRENEARCQAMRDNLNKINTSGRISIIENGDKRYLSPEEIAAKKASIETALQDCS